MTAFYGCLTAFLLLVGPTAHAQTSAQKYPLYGRDKPMFTAPTHRTYQPPTFNDLPRVPGTAPWNNPYYQSGRPFPLQHYVPNDEAG